MNSSNSPKKSRKGCCFSCLLVCVIGLAAIVGVGIFGANLLGPTIQPIVEAIKSGDAAKVHISFIKLIEKHYPEDQMVVFLKGYETKDDSGAAQYVLGEYYEQGKGTEKDMDEAKKWYSKAAEQGYEPAKEALKRLDAPLTGATSEPAPQAEEPKAEETAPKAAETE